MFAAEKPGQARLAQEVQRALEAETKTCSKMLDLQMLRR